MTSFETKCGQKAYLLLWHPFLLHVQREIDEHTKLVFVDMFLTIYTSTTTRQIKHSTILHFVSIHI